LSPCSDASSAKAEPRAHECLAVIDKLLTSAGASGWFHMFREIHGELAH